MLAVVWVRVVAQETEVAAVCNARVTLTARVYPGCGVKGRSRGQHLDCPPFLFLARAAGCHLLKRERLDGGAGGLWEVHRTSNVGGFKLEMLSRPTSEWNVK